MATRDPRPRQAVTLLAFVLVLAGCAAWKRSHPLPPDTLVEYRRTGGIVNASDRLVISRSGRATVTRRTTGTRQFELPAARLREIETALERSNFERLRKTYAPESSGADLIEYTVVYRDHAVRIKDGATPRPLERAIELMDELIARDR